MVAPNICQGAGPRRIIPSPQFDEIFDHETTKESPVKDFCDAKECSPRLASSPCVEQPAITAIDATFYSPSIGKFDNIEHRYQVNTNIIGEGYHGSVRECIDRTTGQRYAVKSIRKDARSFKRGHVIREIMLQREMKHDGIVGLVDAFEDSEHVHLVTDLCTGGELFYRIVEESKRGRGGAPRFEEVEAARVLLQILRSVAYIHARGVVHRDIKPENILFETSDAESRAKICDFGLARKHSGGKMTGIVGTPYYIAPEVLRQRYDKSCDLWSVGVVAYVMLCGKLPFAGSNINETHRAVMSGWYCFHREDWKDVSLEAQDFVRQLLQYRPRERMTADQALNHPWILRHGNSDPGQGSVERRGHECHAMFKGMKIPKKRPFLRFALVRRTFRRSTGFGTYQQFHLKGLFRRCHLPKTSFGKEQ